MSTDDAHPERDQLQFDRVETGATGPGVDAGSPSVTCAVCQKPIDDEYYNINGKPVCETCRQAVASAATTPRGSGPLLRAGLFGLAAAIAGAAIYYGVIAIANLEIGIVAILIGYMVGWAVHKGAGGRGGRRFQILAAVLTYWSVGLAYTPLVFKGMTGQGLIGQRRETSALSPSADSASVVGPTAIESLTTPRTGLPSSGDRSVFVALAMLSVFVFALPVMAIVGSMPGGLISALIIFIGLHQAWRMTAEPKLEISGPYKVGAQASPQPPPPADP